MSDALGINNTPQIGACATQVAVNIDRHATACQLTPTDPLNNTTIQRWKLGRIERELHLHSARLVITFYREEYTIRFSSTIFFET